MVDDMRANSHFALSAASTYAGEVRAPRTALGRVCDGQQEPACMIRSTIQHAPRHASCAAKTSAKRMATFAGEQKATLPDTPPVEHDQP